MNSCLNHISTTKKRLSRGWKASFGRTVLIARAVVALTVSQRLAARRRARGFGAVVPASGSSRSRSAPCSSAATSSCTCGFRRRICSRPTRRGSAPINFIARSESRTRPLGSWNIGFARRCVNCIRRSARRGRQDRRDRRDLCRRQREKQAPQQARRTGDRRGRQGSCLRTS